jgi:hypothetical protein
LFGANSIQLIVSLNKVRLKRYHQQHEPCEPQQFVLRSQQLGPQQSLPGRQQLAVVVGAQHWLAVVAVQQFSGQVVLVSIF